jgi:hypothetical protein
MPANNSCRLKTEPQPVEAQEQNKRAGHSADALYLMEVRISAPDLLSHKSKRLQTEARTSIRFLTSRWPGQNSRGSGRWLQQPCSNECIRLSTLGFPRHLTKSL